MDAFEELFAYFDSRITELPFYYSKKAFFQEFKDSIADPYLKHQSQNWLTLRLKEYCEKHGFQLNPYGRTQQWDKTVKKQVDYIHITKNTQNIQNTQTFS